MNRNVILDSLIGFIENHPIVKKHLANHWMSGSQTLVYPISIWETQPDKTTIEIQVDIKSNAYMFRGFEKQLKYLYADLKPEYMYCKYDGSCPNQIRIVMPK